MVLKFKSYLLVSIIYSVLKVTLNPPKIMLYNLSLYDCIHIGGVVLNQLLDWLRMHFVEGDRIVREALQEDSLECHPEYWNAVSKTDQKISR